MNTDAAHRTRTLWLTGVLHAFTHIYQVALLPLYLLIQRDLNLSSVSQATLLVTVMMAGYVLPSYPMGVLADKLNRKTLLALGLAINGLGFIGLALAPSYAWALVAVLVAGFGGSFFHPSATSMVARLFPVGTGKALGLLGIGASVGFFAGPLYAGWRAAALGPSLGSGAWRRPVLELGLAGLLFATVFAWLAETPQPKPATGRHAGPAPQLFPDASLWVLFLACAFAFSLRDFAGASMGSLGSLFLQHAHGYDPKWTGLALSAIFPASAISNPLFGGLSDRGRNRWLSFVLLAAAGLVALFPMLSANWIIPVLALYGFFFMSSYPMTEAALMESVPDAVRGRVLGLFITVGGLVGNLSHWIMGTLVKRMGPMAGDATSYYFIYWGLGSLLLVSLLGLPCLHAIRQCEGVFAPNPKTDSALAP